jgi:S-(hydroxymethyl)glutathione dehydrogenase/alcohol dehydrogenase
MKTRCALLWGTGQSWSVDDVEIGEPGRGEVTVALEAAGLCHSDHHLVTGCLPAGAFPVLGGHEGAGIVTTVGPGVETLAVGDHVVLSVIPSCGACASCQAGQRNLCDRGGRPTFALGAFAPYAVVHEMSVVKIDPAVPFTVACLLGCAVPTGHGAATRSAGVQPGDDVAVIGLGGVGMSAVQGAVGAGARRVFAIDPIEWKRDAALKFGATHTYADVGAALGGVFDVTDGKMATKVIVAAGQVHGTDVDNWLILTAKGGVCVLAALGDVAETDVTANLAMNILLQKRLQGSLFGGGNPHHDIPLLASMYLAGHLNLDDMVTREYRLDQINEGFQDMLDGNVIRGVIRFTDEDRCIRPASA